MTISNNNLQCNHDSYCSFAETNCKDVAFANKCRMKGTNINELSLLKTIKERVERDMKRQYTQAS